MEVSKKISIIICFLFIAIYGQAAEPQNNLGRSFRSMKSEWQDLRYIKQRDGRSIWGVKDEVATFIFGFVNETVVEEHMLVESNNGFAQEWYEAMLNSFLKTECSSITRTSNGYTFHYSYFHINITYSSDYSGETALISWLFNNQ